MSDFDPPEAYQEALRRARKEHKCCSCWEPIRIGDQYLHISGVWDGRPDSYKWCLDCRELANAAPGGDSSYPLRSMRDHVIDQMAAAVLEFGAT
jgi:hypothetical protein